MDAAFGLVVIAPAARARVLARADGGGAGHAADGRVSARHQRVPGQTVFLHVGAYIARRPMGERVDLDAPAAVLHLEEIERGAGAGLIALAPGDPAVEPRQR